MGQRWLPEKEHATFVCQFSNLLTLNGIIIQLAFCCMYAVNNMHVYVLPTFLNGQTMRANMFAGQFVLFCGTKQPLFFGQKAKAPPPPPGGLPKGASSGKRATGILLRKGFNIYGTYLFAIQPSLAIRWPLHCSHHLWP